MSITVKKSIIVALLFSAVSSLSCLNAHQQQQQKEKPTLNVLALFSDASNDLGIDPRLGKQVLRLATVRAKQIYSDSLADIVLRFQSDETACDNFNRLPNYVAEEYFFGRDFSRSTSTALTNECAREQTTQNDTNTCSLDAWKARIEATDAMALDQFVSTSRTNLNDASESRVVKLAKRSTVELERRVNETIRNSVSSTLKTKRALTSIDVIIGPSCDLLIDLIGRMAAYWQLPVYSVSSVNARFSRKDIYPTLTRLSPSLDHLSIFFIEMMKMFDWKHLAILIDERVVENRIIDENIEIAIRKMQARHPIVSKTISYQPLREQQPLSSNVDSKQQSSMCSDVAKSTLLAAKLVARVFLTLVESPPHMRSLLLCAHELGMNNGEYTFIAINLAIKSIKPVSVQSQPSAALDVASNNSLTTNKLSTSEQAPQAQRSDSARTTQNFDWFSVDDEERNTIARQMYESLMVFSTEQPISELYKVFVDRAIDMATREYPQVRFDKTNVGAMAIALHESLLLAAHAFVESISSTNANNATMKESEERKIALAWNSSYSLGLVEDMFINANGDQELDYSLSDLEPETGIFRPVATYKRSTRRMQMLPDSYIHWPRRTNSANQLLDSDKPPPDMPYCGFNGAAEHCVDRQNMNVALSIIGTIVSLIILATTASLYKYRSIKYEMQLNDEWWKINWDDLHFLESADSIVSAVSATRSGVSHAKIQNAASAAASKAKHKPENPTGKPPKVSTPTQVVVTPAAKNVAASGKPNDNTDAMSSVSSTHQKSIASLTGSMRNVHASMVVQSEYSCVFKSSHLATYKSEVVMVKMLNLPPQTNFVMNRDLLVEMKAIRELLSDNLVKFVGLCIEVDKLAILYSFCSRGNLQALLTDQTIDMDATLKYSIIGDIVNGMHYIHVTQLDFHGRLKSSNLLLDSRFTVKISDFGLQQLFKQMDVVEEQDSDDEGAAADDARSHKSATTYRDARSIAKPSVYNMDSASVAAGKREHCASATARKNKGAARFFWTAPEHLRTKLPHLEGSKKGDVYSFAIILSEIITRHEPYHYGTNAEPIGAKVSAVRRKHGANHFLSSRAVGEYSTVGEGRRMSNVLELPGKHRVSISNNTSVLNSDNESHTGTLKMGGRRPSQMRRKSRIAPIDEQMSEIGSVVSSAVDKHSDQVTQVSPVASHTNLTAGSHVSERKKASMKATEILHQLRMGVLPVPVRPYVPKFSFEDLSEKIVDLMESCWAEEPMHRPTFVQIRASLKRATKGMATKNYMDNLLERLQQYSSNLERIVEEKSGDIMLEKEKTDQILYQLLPRFVADYVKRDEPLAAHQFEGVTVFFSDIVGFEKYATILSPVQLIDLISAIYSSYDSIISSFDVIKIETIVDQFLLASGLSFERLADALETAKAAETTCDAVAQNNNDQVNEEDPAKKQAKKKLMKLVKSVKQPSIEQEPAKPAVSKADQSTPSGNTDTGLTECNLVHSTDSQKRNGAEQIARLALCVKDLVKSFNFRACLGQSENQDEVVDEAVAKSNDKSASMLAATFNIRIGIHSGKVCAGIVGVKRPKYCLIGDTVNVASRMHTNSKANKIHISSETKLLLDKVPGFALESRGKIEIKGKGSMSTFWLDSAY